VFCGIPDVVLSPPEPVECGEGVGRSLGAALVAAGVIVSVLTLLFPFDFLAVICILFVGGFLVVVGFAMILSPGPSIAYRPDIRAADYALREKHYPRKPR